MISVFCRLIDMLLCLPSPQPSYLLPSNDIPHHTVWSTTPVSVAVVKESRPRSMFSFCYAMLDISAFLYPVVHSHLPLSFSLFALCCYLQTSPCFPPPFILPPFSYHPLHHSCQLSTMFSLTHSLVALYRFPISVAHLPPPPSVPVKVEA